MLTTLPSFFSPFQFGDIPNEEEVPLVEGAATIAFSSTFVAVPAGSSVDVILTFVPPTGLDVSNVPVYSVSHSSSPSLLFRSADLSFFAPGIRLR